MTRIKFLNSNDFRTGDAVVLDTPVLDVLLTSSESHICNINILSSDVVCKSDHFALTFGLKLKFKRKKPLKIKTYKPNAELQWTAVYTA